MHVNEVLDLAERMEEGLSECYGSLAKLAKSDELRRGLERLAQEEIDHRNIIRTGRNYLFQAPEAFAQPAMRAEDLQEGLDRCRGLLERLEREKTTLNSALGDVFRLESIYEKVHLSTCLEINDEGLRKLFQALSQGDAEHRRSLEELVARFAPDAIPLTSDP